MHLNHLRWPDRKAIKNERTIDLCESINGKRTASFQLNRGCKVHCKYCAEVVMTGKYNSRTNPIRTRDYRDIINEILYVKHGYGINYFKIVDATFDKDVQTVVEFCMRKISTGLDLPWEANIHPGFVQDEAVFKLLAQANCEQINVGVESGSQRILNKIGKGTKVDHIRNVFKWAKEYGITTRAYFILGMPGEVAADHLLTDKLIEDIRPDYVGFTILCPYPGTDFYSEKFKDIVWSKTDEYSNDFWETDECDNDTLELTQSFFTDKYKGKLCERQEKKTEK
ncbi:MAG: radical SAM protein [Lentisphaerae bacterium]|nr:radical SAM protein [Lentisphaerota bacterium]